MSNQEVFFKWTDEYSVHIKTIDDQHKELVNILNRLFVAVSLREGDKVIAGILDALMSYTQTHFALEERLLKQAKYKDFDAHKEEHRKLLEQLDQLCKKHLMEEKPIYFEMLSFLKRWLKEHIQGVDILYSDDLRQAGFSTTAWEQAANAEFSKMSDSKKWWELWKAA
ncbi:MAG: bacteriohemerythrin [Gammaproteobacteria bacterium]|nr:bacteriohemerythrin [Gammaproteobacteria bacterium]MBU1447829.1 bacteriohemerythrin [Gammaproteobacteria bacterium]MDD5472318.1 bacteriohemerythrin [Sideroxydans sp.]